MQTTNKDRAGWKLQALLGWILFSFLAPLPSAFLDTPYSWYDTLLKPGIVPPGWVFSLVWLNLYFFMGLAAYLVARSASSESFKNRALLLFIVQLVVNSAFNPVFFGWQSLSGGLLIIALLIIIVALTTRMFWQISLPAGIIFTFYLLWLLFAFYLNVSIFILNS